MKKSLAKFSDVGSFIAGLLVGLSIGVLVFAMADADPGDWWMLSVFGAPIILALGITLHIVATHKPRSAAERTRRLEPLPIPLAASNHEL